MAIQGRGDARRVLVRFDRNARFDLFGCAREVDQQVVVGAAIACRGEAPLAVDHPALVHVRRAGAHIVRVQVHAAIERGHLAVADFKQGQLRDGVSLARIAMADRQSRLVRTQHDPVHFTELPGRAQGGDVFQPFHDLPLAVFRLTLGRQEKDVQQPRRGVRRFCRAFRVGRFRIRHQDGAAIGQQPVADGTDDITEFVDMVVRIGQVGQRIVAVAAVVLAKDGAHHARLALARLRRVHLFRLGRGGGRRRHVFGRCGIVSGGGDTSCHVSCRVGAGGGGLVRTGAEQCGYH